MPQQTNRRDFMKVGAAAGIGYWVAGGVTPALSKSPNEQINFACIGVGGKGGSDSTHAGANGNIVAICDCDEGQLDRRQKSDNFKMAKRYTDFRKMLDEMEGSIDAVTVSTPDHTHAPAAAMAIRKGKHAFVQKPLTHSIYEARILGELAKQYKVKTQMGNQGTALKGVRQAAKIVQDGVLGTVNEVHVWTNRPVWPQGININRPEGSETVPSTLNWDAFIGPAKMRPYVPGVYHTFKWRGWWDFGTGALGDMACHTMNMPFMALDLREPTAVEAEGEPHNKETYPRGAKIKFEFPARGDRPALTVYWYEGEHPDGTPYRPSEEVMQGKKADNSGSLIIGDKGRLYSPSDYGESFFLLPMGEFASFKRPKVEAPSTKYPGGYDVAQFKEWVMAMRGEEDQATSNFPDYAGPLTETILLGNLAVWANKRIEWDAKTMTPTNAPELAWMVKHEYREGWTL